MKLTDFEVMSFDCYGTLIDWESGIFAALGPLLGRASVAGMGLARSGFDLSPDTVLQAFARLESRQQEKAPEMIYPMLLAEVHRLLAMEFDVPPDAAEAAAFGASIAEWPPFPDTIDALRYLKQHVRLVILSNVDRASFQQTNARLGVTFDAVYTAQDIGSYKPDRRNFDYMLERLRQQGVTKDKVLHVAQSQFHDHVPANAIGLASAWIDRRGEPDGGATAAVAVKPRFDFRFDTLGALADAHRAAV